MLQTLVLILILISKSIVISLVEVLIIAIKSDIYYIHIIHIIFEDYTKALILSQFIQNTWKKKQLVTDHL